METSKHSDREQDNASKSYSLKHWSSAQYYDMLRHTAVFILPGWQNFSSSLMQNITLSKRKPQQPAFTHTFNWSTWNLKGVLGFGKRTSWKGHGLTVSVISFDRLWANCILRISTLSSNHSNFQYYSKYIFPF